MMERLKFKTFGVYVCSLVEEDIKSSGFLLKKSNLKLVEHVVNFSGHERGSSFEQSYFFLSFYEEEGSLKAASFGYSWMNPLGIADSPIGSPDDGNQRMKKECFNFVHQEDVISFSYLFGDEEFEIECLIEEGSRICTYSEPKLQVRIRNVSKSIECDFMYFRFVARLRKEDVKSRYY